jgi:hypothetical protein
MLTPREALIAALRAVWKHSGADLVRFEGDEPIYESPTDEFLLGMVPDEARKALLELPIRPWVPHIDEEP